MTTHWDQVALPVLDQCVDHWLRTGQPPQTHAICEATQIAPETVSTALSLLAADGYLEGTGTLDGEFHVSGVHPSALRAVGQWPNSNNEAFGNAMIEALEKIAAGERDEQKSQALQAAASDLRSIGVNGAGQVLGTFLKGVVGL